MRHLVRRVPQWQSGAYQCCALKPPVVTPYRSISSKATDVPMEETPSSFLGVTVGASSPSSSTSSVHVTGSRAAPSHTRSTATSSHGNNDAPPDLKNGTTTAHAVARTSASSGAIATLLAQQRDHTAALEHYAYAPPLLSTSHTNPLDELQLTTANEVEAAFRCSVQARTVSNAQLRRYIEQLPSHDFALAVAAVTGSRDGGLRPNPQTYEALLDKLVQGGQLRPAMQLYQEMIQHRMTPTTNTYATLMQMCLDREMPSACQSLFHDIEKRGVRPDIRNIELMITALSMHNPPQWELAVQLFDKLTSERHSRVNSRTYNALMLVYLHMRPFDWRVVYNCYFEMRTRLNPEIQLEWTSYLILREALRLGGAGYVRRFLVYCDAWFAVTPIRSMAFVKGALVFFVTGLVIKTVVSAVGFFVFRDALRPMALGVDEAAMPGLFGESPRR